MPRAFLGILFVSVFMFLPLDRTIAGARGQDPLHAVRARVLAAARPAFRSWIDSVPSERLASFGFPSPETARQAGLLAPVPLYRPDRSEGALTRARIEGGLNDPPGTWLVPVEVEGRIVSLVTVEARPEKAPEAIEFGKPWAAGRLDGGARLLEEQGELRWEDLRFLAFNSPNADLLLVRSGKGWKWLELGAAAGGEARALEATRIEELLATLREPPLQEMP